jgi:hypothetical protein
LGYQGYFYCAQRVSGLGDFIVTVTTWGAKKLIERKQKTGMVVYTNHNWCGCFIGAQTFGFG